MTSRAQRPSLDDVLNAFAVEHDQGSSTLARYLKEFPEYANDIVDLSRELHRTVLDEDAALLPEDLARIETAWQGHVNAAPAGVPDPLAALSVAQVREVATALGVPRQVLAAFRQHRVVASSVPAGFLARLAALIKASAEEMREALIMPPTLSGARNYKADVTPEEGGPITFERLLIDAGVSEKKRALLMSSGDE